jgi:hypothetical protein
MRVISLIALYIEDSSICVVPIGVDLHQIGFCSFDRKQYFGSLSHLRVNFAIVIGGTPDYVCCWFYPLVKESPARGIFSLSPYGYGRAGFCQQYSGQNTELTAYLQAVP